jgi:hypothetical protein
LRVGAKPHFLAGPGAIQSVACPLVVKAGGNVRLASIGPGSIFSCLNKYVRDEITQSIVKKQNYLEKSD